MTAIRLRAPHWTDLAGVAALERELFEAQPWSEAQFWAELARVPESRWYVVAESGNGLIGYAGLYLAPPDADVQTIAVAPAAQGQGLGGVLLRALLDHARDAGCTRVLLEVEEGNAAARALYARYGFAEQGRRRDYYGTGLDALVLVREESAAVAGA